MSLLFMGFETVKTAYLLLRHMTWAHTMRQQQDEGEYLVCPDCGFKQKSNADKRVTCHRCGRSYQPEKAKRADKTPDPEKGTGFFKYSETDK